jgi:DNA modification methylase
MHEKILKGHKTAESRWARFGPYYAMFPLEFAFGVVEKYSEQGNYIIDPFAGRGSSIFAGGVLGRLSLGIEINPVGWLYGKIKLAPAPQNDVLTRLAEINVKKNDFSENIEKMPEFFRICYSDDVLKFLLASRQYLDWKNNNVDATLMAIILVYLHGKIGEGLSNQMKMAKSMAISYSIKWRKENGFEKPPELDPYNFLKKKIAWRFEKGTPNILADSRIVFGDSTIELPMILERANKNNIKFSLLFTSPPYCSITNYHADQWLRLWMLGGVENQSTLKEKHKGRFVNRQEYYNLLDDVFNSCSKMMSKNATVYVRTDIRKYTLDTTKEILKKHFSDYEICINESFIDKQTQIDVFGNSSSERGEIDIILTRKNSKCKSNP